MNIKYLEKYSLASQSEQWAVLSRLKKRHKSEHSKDAEQTHLAYFSIDMVDWKKEKCHSTSWAQLLDQWPIHFFSRESCLQLSSLSCQDWWVMMPLILLPACFPILLMVANFFCGGLYNRWCICTFYSCDFKDCIR